MNEKTMDNNEELEIDLRRIFEAIWNRLWVVILSMLLCASCAFGITHYLITPMYESSAMFYVNNNAVSLGDTSFSISQGDITASKSLVDSYIVILKTRSTLTDVIDYSGLNMTYAEVKDMISASSVDSTEIFKIVVTHSDPRVAEIIADSISYILPKRISSIIEGTSAEIVDTAVLPSSPSSPSYMKNIAIGAILGMLVSIGWITLKELLDVTIRNEEDIEYVCQYPLLATVPNMRNTSSTSSYGHYYDTRKKSKKKKKNKQQTREDAEKLFGENLSFAASEAYKLLRAKLQFSFADEKNSHVIGVSSALAGEGKSVTATNIAYSLAQLNKRILLLDCDLRKPTLHTKIGMEKQPGLSNYLAKQINMVDVIQVYNDKEVKANLSFIAAGNNPPNPIELLSSTRMSQAIEQFKEVYDYIIIDLPPIGEVSDAISISNLLDGIVLVVRENYCSRPALSSAINQFEFVGTKVLGLVLNFAEDTGKGYGKNYKKYYKYGYYYKK